MPVPGNEVSTEGPRQHQSDPEEDPAWQLRKYLLLLAILVATVTYVAGLDPPGGVWLETKDGHRTGNPILPATRRVQYTLFYYFNATAFAVSLVVSILLLFMRNRDHARPLAVRGIMVIDVCCLMVAYVAGSCRGNLTTIYASVVCAAVFLFVIIFTSKYEQPVAANVNLKETRKVLMLLAIFVVTITYTAALNSPGGFWEHADQEEGHNNAGHRAGDPILLERHWARFVVFLIFNTTAFAASLVIVTLLVSTRLQSDTRRLSILRFAIVVALVGILVSYAAGSTRKTKTTAFIFSLVGLVAMYIAVVALLPWWDNEQASSSSGADTSPHKEDRSLILLLGTLAATVTYQAGLSPPGGVWRDNGSGHTGGDLILPATHAGQYKVFYFCNSAAFVMSIIVVMMVQSKELVHQHALKAAVILDLLGLLAAYIAGSCRQVLSSIYVLAAVMIVFVVIIVVVKRCSTSPPEWYQRVDREREEKMKKRRKLLLLLAILAVTVTYQAGLSPPGKFWLEDGAEAHHVGDPVLADNYPRRYKVFFYSNTASFMLSIAVIVILVGRQLSDTNRDYWWYWLLKTSMFISLIGLAGLLLAYAAGTTRRVKTSIYILALVPLVLLVALLQVHYIYAKLEGWLRQPGARAGEENGGQPSEPAGEPNGGQPSEPAGEPNGGQPSEPAGELNGGQLSEPSGEKNGVPEHPGAPAGEANGVPGQPSAPATEANGVSGRPGAPAVDANGVPGQPGAPAAEANGVTGQPGAIAGVANGVPGQLGASASDGTYKMRKYLMLVGILAASVTYQAGLDPPGGVWPRDGHGHAAGDPSLHNGDRGRYHAFFYTNSTCFVASVVVIVLLLHSTLRSSSAPTLMKATRMVVVLDLLGLLVAYAVGSSRDWLVSGCMLAMAAIVLACAAIYVLLSKANSDGHNQSGRNQGNSNVTQRADTQRGNDIP